MDRRYQEDTAVDGVASPQCFTAISYLHDFFTQVVMKTCGTTTLLRCVATLLQAALEEQGLVLEWMGYSRKNFTFPGDQLFPHSSFQQELQYLGAHAHLEKRLNGAGIDWYGQ